MKKTPLADTHVNLGARMVDFAGWYMPVQYVGLREEHDNVRKNVGLFDVSHMGEVRVKGPKALETLEWLTTNDVAKLNDGEAQYSLLPNDQGGLVDDIIVYCLKKNEDYLVCVNASNKDKDFAWMNKHNNGADLVDESDLWGQIAIQGPKALELCDRVFGFKVSEMKPFHLQHGTFQNHKIMVATTGYTGEKGCEVFVEAGGTVALWNELLEKGKDLGVMAIGLGARDTLRTEVKYSLYGHEIDDTTNPYEAGLGWVIKPAKKDFMGKVLIVGKKEAGLTKSLIGFKMLEKGIPRQGYSLFSFDNKEIGKVTSGTHSPTLDEPIGIAYIDLAYAKEGTEFHLDIRGRKVKAVVVKTPFVQK
ncbi:glycine cleavage system aminomethyltransferase GcvT [Bdellovibrio reynosensis]|uniref:Aminomethyltransferase n=1 Tax=Bdellovibrio reynosensis TaxID=2835041 RepID=A0ABY4C4I4_9BACT|nr:glycine cleavage system aminomethyltransferase GcvT [Bdellovibrio reynosensis]UOE99804.1 glycine cleavage system aminomethyltransferase GcvT [Bdellovibrio reynosensis]